MGGNWSAVRQEAGLWGRDYSGDKHRPPQLEMACAHVAHAWV